MTQKRILRVVVASPGDVQAERDTLPAVIDELNRGIAAERNLLLELLRWETDAYPGFHHDGPQGLIDPVLNIEDCDILIGIFWKRFGTPTKDAGSGTEHEILSAYKAWHKNRRPQIMVYFKQRGHSEESKEGTEQWDQVSDFKRRFPKEGFWWEYTGKDEFERLVRNHLTQFIRHQYPIEDAQAVPIRVSDSEVLAYLDALAGRAAELPAYYPTHLRTGEAGKTRFDNIRQMVQVVEDRSGFQRWLAEEREQMRAAEQGLSHIAYKPTRARLESGEREEARPGLSAPPPPVPWDERAGKSFKRAIILGDPGFGKTWLLRYEASYLSNEAARQLRAQTTGLDKLTLPIFARLSDLNQSDDPLEEALIALAGKGRSDQFRRFVREKLSSDRCVILLDAWDEVRVEVPTDGQPISLMPHSRQRLGKRLEDFAHQFPQPRLLLTSRIVGYDSAHLPVPDLQELELLAFDLPQIESFAAAWFGDDTQAANQLLAMLRESPQVRGLARIPLMLTILCRTYAECREKRCDFPTRRVELYEHCLRGLLRDWKGEKEQRAISDAYVDAVLELLHAVGYTLFVEGYEQFSESDLRERIIAWRASLKYKHELDDDHPTLIIDKLKRDGILITAGEHRNAPLLFLHRTFHEYSTASALAQQSAWLKQALGHVYDPAWQEVLRLLGGLVKGGVESYVMALLRENANDLLHRPLRAAVFAAMEADAKHLSDALSESLLKQVINLYCDPPNVLLSEDDLRPLVSCWGKRATPPLFIRLNDERYRVRGAAARALGEIRAVEAAPRLLPLLGDKDSEIRAKAVKKLGQLGSAELIPHLLPLLNNLSPGVRDEAWKALVNIGSGATQHLLPLLRDKDETVRMQVSEILGQLGSAELIPHLLPLLRDGSRGVSLAAARALRNIGQRQKIAVPVPKLLRRNR